MLATVFLEQNNPHGRSLRVLPAPRGGRCACGPAKPVPRPLLEKTGSSDLCAFATVLVFCPSTQSLNSNRSNPCIRLSNAANSSCSPPRWLSPCQVWQFQHETGEAVKLLTRCANHCAHRRRAVHIGHQRPARPVGRGTRRANLRPAAQRRLWLGLRPERNVHPRDSADPHRAGRHSRLQGPAVQHWRGKASCTRVRWLLWLWVACTAAPGLKSRPGFFFR